MALEIKVIPTLRGASAEQFVVAAERAEKRASERCATDATKRHQRITAILRKAEGSALA